MYIINARYLGLCLLKNEYTRLLANPIKIFWHIHSPKYLIIRTLFQAYYLAAKQNWRR